MPMKDWMKLMGMHARRLIPPLGIKIEAEMLLMAGASAALLFLFVQVADLVVAGRTHAIDEALMLAMRSAADPAEPFGPPWFREMMRDFTSLGSTGVLLVIVAVVSGFLALSGHGRDAALVVVLTATGVAVATIAKLGFERPRPDLVPHATQVFTLSFPSQHALMSAVVYLTLAALIARTLAERRLRIYVMTVAILLTVLVGASRVYLGVHWPSDVLAGWSLGAAWAAICWIAAKLWMREP